MIKTIIFDFDGTIADTLSVIVKLFNKNSKKYHLPKISKKELENLRSMEPIEIIKKYGISLIEIPFIANKIKKDLNSEIDKAEMQTGIRELILELKSKKYRMGILTSNAKENVEKFLNSNKLSVFDFIHSELNLFGKNRSLENIIKKFSLKKEEVIYVGDEVRDIDACKEAGIKIISVTWGFNKKKILAKNKPDYLIDNPLKILEIVNI